MSKKVPQLAFDIDNHLDKIQDFPIPGILFYDISSLIGNAEAWTKTIDSLAMSIQDLNPETLFGIESRGFLIAGSLATKLGIGMQMIRKKGKLPGKTISSTYELEYGQDAFAEGEMDVLTAYFLDKSAEDAEEEKEAEGEEEEKDDKEEGSGDELDLDI